MPIGLSTACGAFIEIITIEFCELIFLIFVTVVFCSEEIMLLESMLSWHIYDCSDLLDIVSDCLDV